MPDFCAFSLALHDLYEEQAHGSSIISLEPDEPDQIGVDDDPHLVVRVRPGSDGGIVGDEVVGVLVAVDGEQPGSREPVSNLGAVESAVQHVDEDGGDVGNAVGFVSNELG